MQAIILAGGAGTRLRSIVSDRPKSMAGFGERPFLEYQVDLLRQQGIVDVVLCTGYMHEHIEKHFGDGRRWGVHLRYAVERTPLGTGGALRHALALLEPAFLLLNGDSYLELDARALLAFHRARRAAERRCRGSIALVRVDDASAYGAVDLDDDGRVVDYGEKARAGPAWVSAGVAVLERALVETLPVATPLSLEKDVLPRAIRQGARFYGFPAQGFFVDIGTPAGHRVFQDFVEGGKP
jgi:NDP-sugar pyrophosphorylase family protein